MDTREAVMGRERTDPERRRDTLADRWMRAGETVVIMDISDEEARLWDEIAGLTEDKA